MGINLQLDNLADNLAPLYHRYPGQTGPQPAYVQLDEDGDVTADWSGEIGNAVPMHVWHGRTLRWGVSESVRCDVLAELLRGDALPLLERIYAGHSVEWNGHNHVGRLDNDAQEASDALERMLADLSGEAHQAQVWDVGDWLQCSLDQVWTDQPLADAAEAVDADAAAQGAVLEGDTAEALLDMAERMLDTGRDGLTAAHIAALVEAGRITQDDADEYSAPREPA